MTCVVALESGPRVLMGADSFLGDECISDRISSPKVFPVGPLLFGFAGMIGLAQQVQHVLSFRAQKRGESDMGYLVGHVAAEIKEAAEGGEGTSILVGYKGRAYEVQVSTGAVLGSKRGYLAIGAGAQYAYGAMSAFSGDPEERVTRALEAAAEWSPFVAAPYDLIWTSP